MKKLLVVVLLLVGLFSFRILPVLDLALVSEKIKNDSGWDSSYDSGGGSSYSGGSSYDSDSGGGDGSVSIFDFVMLINIFFNLTMVISLFDGIKNEKLQNFLMIFVFVSILIAEIASIILVSKYIVIIYLIVSFSVTCLLIYLDSKKIKNAEEIEQAIFEKYDFEKVLLENELYSIFLEVQTAWMNFNYKKLQKLCTDELYNTYKSQLEVLSIKNGKNIMSDFTLNNIKIFDITEENDLIVVKAYMNVSFYDYVIDCRTAKVTRGRKDVRLTNEYEMIFVKHKHRTVKHCPSCGSELNGQRICPYCRSVVYNNNKGFVLSKKMIRR